MKPISNRYTRILVLFFAAMAVEFGATSASVVSCPYRWSPCFRKKVSCPAECPFPVPSDPNARGCFLDCNSPICEAVCKHRKPNCNGQGSGCYDPRFIGGDGTVFYFHGRKGEHFSLVSEPSFQINARFIGLRPSGRTRDFTWIQALGIMFGSSHSFAIEAARAEQWDPALDHLQFSYDGEPLLVPEGHLSEWKSPDRMLTVERTGSRNSISVTLDGLAEVSINVVPVTEEDDRIHNYQIPSDDSYSHLEVQFRFIRLSPEVDGVLGRTYRPGYQNPAKRGVAMPVVGGEDKYKTWSLLSPHCKFCVYSLSESETAESLAVAKDLEHQQQWISNFRN